MATAMAMAMTMVIAMGVARLSYGYAMVVQSYGYDCGYDNGYGHCLP